jgi:hypothetical protein
VLPRSLGLGASIVTLGFALAACDAPPSAPNATTSRAERDIDGAALGAFDGDSIVNLGDVYDVSQHFSFAAGHEVHRIVSIAFIQTAGSPISPANEVCTVPPRKVLTLVCPATDLPGAYAGYWLVTVKGRGVTGSFHLYVLTVQPSPLTLSSAFDGDSITRAGHPYDVAQHFSFPVLKGLDTVTTDAVVNLPSVQWVLSSGVAPNSPPSCAPALDVLVLDCPASSASGFVGYYSVTVQEASFNGIANPAFRGAFNLYVNRWDVSSQAARSTSNGSARVAARAGPRAARRPTATRMHSAATRMRASVGATS